MLRNFSFLLTMREIPHWSGQGKVVRVEFKVQDKGQVHGAVAPRGRFS